MWAKGVVAAGAAAAEVSLAKRVPLQSRCVLYRWIRSPRAARSCAGRLQLLLAISLTLQLLQSTDHRIPIMLFCFATKPKNPPLQGIPLSFAFATWQRETQLSPAAAAKAFANLASAAASALSAGNSTPATLASPHAEARLPLGASVGGSQRHESNFADEGDMYRDGEWPRESQQAMPEAVHNFVHALNSLLGSAKRKAPSPMMREPQRSVTRGNPNPNSTMGWSLRDTESEKWDAGGATAAPSSKILGERPAWLLPEHRSSLLTRRSVAPAERGTCPAVGGFGHPVGREFDELEDWDELLCRSGGVLRKTNSPDLHYDTLVLVKGYQGGDASLEESVGARGDDLGNSADNFSVDSISANGKGKSGPSFGASNRSRSRRSRGGASEGKQKGIQLSKESSSENSPPLHRKTEAELEDELNEVVDLLSMLHCHLANVVDLRHPSNFQLYAHIRQVALRRSVALRERKKADLQFSTQQDSSVAAVVKGQTRNYGRNPSRFTPYDSDSLAEFAEAGGVMRGHRMSKPVDTTSSWQDHQNHDVLERRGLPHAPVPRVSRRGFGSFRGSYSPRNQENKEAKVMPFPAASGTHEVQEHASPTVPVSALDGNTSIQRQVSEGGLIHGEDPEDGSGPVLVVVRNLSARERLFFGAREIREFLFSKLLQTAYEIRAYNEFKQSLFALARKKRSFSLTETESADAANNSGLNRSKSHHLGPASTAVRRIPAFKNRPAAAAQQVGDTSEGLENAYEDGSILTEKSAHTEQQINSVTSKFPVPGVMGKSTNRYDDIRSDKLAAGGVEHEAPGGRPTERDSTEADGRAQTAELPWHTPAMQPAEPEFLFAEDKERQPWWAPLGLRFDLYVSLAGVTPDRVTISPTASLLRLVSEPRMRTLVCVYDYDDPKTDIPPILRANGSVALPALVLGRRVTTGARSIERLLVSIAEYRPPVPYSLQQYAPRFLVREPVFSEVLAAATVTSTPVTYTHTRGR